MIRDTYNRMIKDKLNNCFTTYFTVFLCLLSILASTNAYALEVKNIRFGEYPNKVRMVLDLNEITDFRAFILSSPPRLVIDLPEFSWKAGSPKKLKRSMVTDIRQGKLTPEISRIVFDLNQTVTINSAFLLPKQGGKENRLVIDYSSATLKKFNDNKGNIHGTLKISDYKNTDVPTPPKNATRPNNPSNKVNKKPLIIIDPGHGGADPGTVSRNKVYEKDIVLSLAKELKKQLIASGRYRVLLTRETDIFIRLKNRVKFARKHGGDLFLSLHVNSNKKSHVRGTSIYTLSKKASDAQTARLAEKENQSDMIAGVDFHVEDEQVAFILGDFLMNDTMNQSKFLANTLVNKIRDHGIYTLQNTHRYAGFAVLKAPDIPSVLVETGFISNKKDLKLLKSTRHKKRMAKSIITGIDAYFSNVYKNEQN